MEEYRKEIEEKISELESWKRELQAEATRRVWTSRVAYFIAGWNFGKLLTKKSTFLSNFVMGASFFMGRSAGRDVAMLSHDYNIASRLIEEKEEELEQVKKIEEQQAEEKQKQLTLENVKGS